MGVDISDLHAAGAAPEWIGEKAVSYRRLCSASGISTVLGTVPPVLGSSEVASLLTSGAVSVVRGSFAVELDPKHAAKLMIDYIESQLKKPGM